MSEWRARQHDFLAALKPSTVVARRLTSLRRAVSAAVTQRTAASSSSASTSDNEDARNGVEDEVEPSWIGVHVRRDDSRVRRHPDCTNLVLFQHNLSLLHLDVNCTSTPLQSTLIPSRRPRRYGRFFLICQPTAACPDTCRWTPLI